MVQIHTEKYEINESLGINDKLFLATLPSTSTSNSTTTSQSFIIRMTSIVSACGDALHRLK